MKYSFFNREVSWLSFNERVLEEACNTNLSVSERLRFMSIFASNLDEFYKVKIYSYHKLKDNKRTVLKKINNIVAKHQKLFNSLFLESVVPQLNEEGIEIISPDAATDEVKTIVSEYFDRLLINKIRAVRIKENKPLPFIKDNTVYLTIKAAKIKSGKQHYFIMEIPFKGKERFVKISKGKIIFAEDVVRMNAEKILPGYKINDSYCIKILRNADFEIDDKDDDEIVARIEDAVKKREIAPPSVMFCEKGTPQDILTLFEGGEDDKIEAGRYIRLIDLESFPLGVDIQKSSYMENIPHPAFEKEISIFKAIKKQDILLHFPYHSFDYILRFLRHAAIDKKTKEIKLTWYRVAGNSAIANALIAAAMNGKRVTVFIELKARFDEERNIYFAKLMKKAGVRIIYTVPGFKVHAKMLMVSRKNKNNEKSIYSFLSTGNFNEKTANIYTDHGLFTADKAICEDIANLFLDIEKGTTYHDYPSTLVAPVNLKNGIIEKIEREISNHKRGLCSGIIFKMNGLQNKKVIKKLYEASIAGVKIQLLVRGICCLVPNKEYSKNISVKRIVGQYLEHGRIYIFNNNDQPEVYAGSADMMTRNLNRRIEVIFPVNNHKLKQEIIDIVNISLNDNVNATYLGENLENIKIKKSPPIVQSQTEIWKYLKNSINNC